MCNISLSFGDIMVGLTALFTGGLLWVAWLAYEKLLVQEARKKQLEIVVHLVEKLKYLNLKWAKIIMENREPKLDSLLMQTFFSMPMNQRPEKNYRMFVPSTDASFVWLQDFSHPLMPEELVNSWRKLVGGLSPRPHFQSDNPPDIFYCVLLNPTNLSKQGLESYFEINEGTDQFFDGILALRQSITRWFSNHGIDNINTGVIW
ncbi:MAG TPA: hypothetical protein VK772_07730 [Puia sp.]|jgi:hypothetical protein|nr:hypothetical protein [Puia sp.]